MALSQRPASRFFAAFYRWNRHAYGPPLCIHTGRYQRSSLQHYSGSNTSRSFTTTSLRRQNEEGVEQLKEDAGQGPVSQNLKGEEPNEPNEADVLRQSVRSLMRHVPNPVVVITAACIDPERNVPVPLGIAVSSFATVTLDPPTISFNIRHPSRTLDAIKGDNGRFRVHFLASDQKAARIADLFTKGNNRQIYAERRYATKIFMRSNTDNLYAASPHGVSNAPQIQHKAVVAALECELTQELPVADHVIVVAKVSSIESRALLESTLMYVQGKYVKTDGAILHENNAPVQTQTVAVDAMRHRFYHLMPGKEDRQAFKQHIREHLEKNQHLLDMTSNEAAKRLQYELNFPMGAFGLSLRRFVAQVQMEIGRPHDLYHWEMQLPILHEFYGRLSPNDMAFIIERAKRFAKEDIGFLSLHHKKLFSLLSVDPFSTGILASDILDPLRAEGLLPPVHYSPLPHSRGPEFVPDLEYLEQIEHGLREYLRTQNYDYAARMTAEELTKAIGETGWVKSYVKQIRVRLHVESAPELFNASKIDISGEVTAEEARVVIDRIARLIHNSNFNFQMAQPWWETMRHIGVHPLVSGVYPEHLVGKVGYMFRFTPTLRQWRNFMSQMLDKWFQSHISWEELETRVDNLVQNAPLRAVTWSRKDILAALALTANAETQSPISANPTPLLTGTIIPKLLGRAIKKYHPKLEEENEEVAKFLGQLDLLRGRQAGAENGRERTPNKKPAPHDSKSLGTSDLEMMQAMLENAPSSASHFGQDSAKPSPKSDLRYKHLDLSDGFVFRGYGLDGKKK